MSKILIEVNTKPTRWVSSTFPRVGGIVGAELTDNIENAHDFLTMERAREVVSKIYNPFDRVFTAVSNRNKSATQRTMVNDKLK